jgi:myo-inositol-1(or 4)-monophosphatase
MDLNKEELLEQALRFTKFAGDHTLNYFRKNIEVEYKGDDSPVTRADREAEEILRRLIMDAYPDHGIVGEEYGVYKPEARIQWILDPVDGTMSFIHGIPLYTTLVGILVDGNPEIGLIYAPAMDEMVDAALGLGTRLNGSTVTVRQCDSLGKATILTTDIRNVETYGFGVAHSSLVNSCYTHRTWGDAYGHLMVATGRADIMIDPILNIWDAAPLSTVLREAGGVFMTRDGVENIYAGHGISTGLGLKNEIMNVLKTQ